MAYIDGFVIAVPTINLEAYEALSRRCGEIWREHGALAYVECVGDDVPYGERTSFPRAVQATADETIVFAWIVYDSKDGRAAVNAKVFDDPRMKSNMEAMPFDTKRMIYGGFRSLVEM